MWQNHAKMTQTLIGVGAAFDFHAGRVQRAPRWMQKSGLEWAYRLSQEPGRLLAAGHTSCRPRALVAKVLFRPQQNAASVSGACQWRPDAPRVTAPPAGLPSTSGSTASNPLTARTIARSGARLPLR
ncbi:MAG: WecB/TagA/CpsF family glycosyltransferase [Sphingomonadaceae bacterium]